jgi:hypothetical protein
MAETAANPDTHTSNKERVLVFDTTLRDGEQSPGASMTFEEKLEVADLLDAMGVDIIEAGFPIASDGDFEAVSAIAKRVKRATVAGLARAAFKDIDRCAEAVKHAVRPRIHTFISTSPLHMKYKLQKEPAEVLQMVTAQVRGPAITSVMLNGRLRMAPGPSSSFCAVVSKPRSKPVPRRSIFPIQWAMQFPRNMKLCLDGCANRFPILTEQFFQSIAIMTLALRWPIRSLGSKAEPGKSNARLTGSASAPETLRLKKSSWR